MELAQKRYCLRDTLQTAYRSASLPAVLVGANHLTQSMITTLRIVVTARFLDIALQIAQGDAPNRAIYPSLLLLIAFMSFSTIGDQLIKLANTRLSLAIKAQFRTAITEKRGRLSYRHVEDSDTWDLVSRVAQAPDVEMLESFNNLFSLAATLLRIAGVLYLLASQVWWVAIIIACFSFPLLTLSLKSGRAHYQTDREVSTLRRKCDYLSEVMTSRESVEERTLFGYSSDLNGRYQLLYADARDIERRARRIWGIRVKIGSAVTALVSIAAALVLLSPVISGAITVGMFIALVNAMFGLVQMMSWNLNTQLERLTRHREYLRDLTDFAALSEVDEGDFAPDLSPQVFESLVFEDVTFCYPGSLEPVFRNLSFEIRAGKQYAFVGINGAGKTTIIKLISRLYDNFKGQILLNGRPIQQYNLTELRTMISVVNQDFARYQISVEDNVAIGLSVGPEERKRRVEQALRQVGLEERVSILPQGEKTPLGKLKVGGQDFSGGEWQRLAMARSLVSQATLRILDEPTAALDPLSESRVYSQFEEITQGTTSIVISHRLGSTKIADEILVLHAGCIWERGSHAQLIAAGGLYAEMYDSQRSWYQDE